MHQLLELQGSQTVRTAPELQRALLAALDAGADVALDISDIAELDLSFVQTVCSARHHAVLGGKTLRLARPAPGPVAALLTRAGFLTDITPDDLDFWFHGVLAQ
ncbi:STAS domain-containing protein [Sphingomonas kyeonggiensis]|uniref:Anti-anti-sigma regulatory factor n=1 Tax=Sphingomonas kyeonggiensis TaxID=1268553 RepID=A0A7W6NVY6_9SPHN|nr:STAS domain-containing protein [Sphingomonas kyeonggiensis]MBB4097613.1 anti-anti-sigma regulatory factor [Sphingomonas kyeonggiensis]